MHIIKYYIFLSIMFLATCGYAFELPPFSAQCVTVPVYFEAELGAGYRQDHFRWNMAGPENQPNILSELTWKDLEIALFQAEGILEVYHVYTRLTVDYGHIFHGRETDRDFAGHNRTEIFSDTRAKSNKGEVFDITWGLGYLFEYCGFQFIPLAGYSHHEQHLHMHDLVVDFDAFSSHRGPLSGLHSNYKAKWRGPWLGFDFNYSRCGKTTLYGTFEYHWARYRATGHWNLRTDFIDDFRQRANGQGQLYKLGIQHLFTCYFGGSLEASYQTWETGHGRDRVFFFDGFVDSRFNEARWHSYSIVGSAFCIF